MTAIRVTGELLDDRLAAYVENPDGTERRIAGDERNLPLSDYSHASTLPGGFSTSDAEMLVPERQDFRAAKFAPVTFRHPDRTIAWEGRLESTPHRSEERTVSLSCIGHQAALEDEPGVVFLGVVSDLTLWDEPPENTLAAFHNNNWEANGKFTPTISEGGITFKMVRSQSVVTSDIGLVWFSAPAGALLDEVQYVSSNFGGTMQGALLFFDVLGTVNPAGGTFATVNDLAVRSQSPTTPTRYVAARYRRTADGSSALQNQLHVHRLSLYGDHSLPRRSISGLPDGLYFSDVLRHLVEQHTILRTEHGGESTIEESSVALPDLAWLEPTGLGDIVEEGVGLEHDRDWAVWENRALHYKRRQSMGRTWTLRRSEGARFIDTGETSEPDYNQVLVVFTDRDGTSRRAGAPGTGADVEDTALRDPDPENPVNASSAVGDRTLLVSVSQTVSDSKAVEMGEIALAEALRPRFAGEVEVPRYAEREGQMLPTTMVRAGDRVVDGDKVGGEEMLLVGATYSRSRGDRPMTATVDTPSNRLDAALAGLEVAPRSLNRGAIRERDRRLRDAARRRMRKRLRRNRKRLMKRGASRREIRRSQSAIKRSFT